MFSVHHVIARLEIEGFGGESGEMRFAARGTRDEVRSLEQVFRSEHSQLRIGEDRAALDAAANQINARHRPRQIRALARYWGVPSDWSMPSW